VISKEDNVLKWFGEDCKRIPLEVQGIFGVRIFVSYLVFFLLNYLQKLFIDQEAHCLGSNPTTTTPLKAKAVVLSSKHSLAISLTGELYAWYEGLRRDFRRLVIFRCFTLLDLGLVFSFASDTM
jgi:hypothetical protein